MRPGNLEKFIEKATEIHNGKYDYSLVAANEPSSVKSKIKIICPIHGVFETTFDSHVNGKSDCPKCSGVYSPTTEEFVERLKEVFKNKDYDFSRVNYVDNKEKVEIICHEKNVLGVEHGSFWAKPGHLLNGHGCPNCSNRYMTTEEWIARAMEIHGDKYDYSNVEYHNDQNEKQSIICHEVDEFGEEHGEFIQSLGSHLSGVGCPKCRKGVLMSKESFVKRSKLIHGKKYEYSSFNYVNARTLGGIICPTHGLFLQTPYLHLRGSGCPRCKGSRLEDRVARGLESVGLCYKTQVRINLGNQTVDFYVPEKNVYIECQGEQHYRPIAFTDEISSDVWAKVFEERKILDNEKFEAISGSGSTIVYYTDPSLFIDKDINPNAGWYADKVVYTRIKNLVDNLCSMESRTYEEDGKKPKKVKMTRRRWNYDTCKEEAKKYSSKSEMKAGCQSAYSSSVKHGWIDEFFDSKKYPDGWWNDLTNCINASRECSGPRDMIKKFGGCYNSVKRHGWSTFMEYAKKDKGDMGADSSKKCPYCNWTTSDLTNKSGSFLRHLRNIHNIGVSEYLNDHPEDNAFFSRQVDLINKKEAASDKTETVANIVYNNRQDDLSIRNEICSWFSEYNVAYDIDGDDIIVGNVAIKVCVNNAHTERAGGKGKNYHLDVMNEAKEKGLCLIQMFSDEFVEHPEIVKTKLMRMLGVNCGFEKVYGRKCTIDEVDGPEAEKFLNDNHIQGYAASTVYMGAFEGGQLIGVMTFIDEGGGKWNLNRFATDIHKSCIGVGGKLFMHFMHKYEPNEVKSFADRRWTLSVDKNLYTNLGFTLKSILGPEYRYYKQEVDEHKRFHKFGFRKETLSKKYGLPMSMTESEMTKKLGYDRIWDCGLFKYVWKKNSPFK